MKDYINVEAMQVTLFELLKETREGMRNAETERTIDNNFDDDYLNESAFELASSINSEMKAYLHQKDHHIVGNFNNIEYGYNKFRTGEGCGNNALLDDMIARLDNNDQGEQSKKDRDFLNDWYFETNGTFGITYNFESEISDRVCEDQNDKEY